MLVTAKETCFYGGKLRFKGDSFEFEGDDLPVCMIKIEAEVEAEATIKSKKKV